MSLICGSCSAEIHSHPSEDSKLHAGKCECDGMLSGSFILVCEECGKRVEFECFHLNDCALTQTITRDAQAKSLDGSDLVLQHLWKQVAYAADAVNAYLSREHDHPEFGMKETVFSQVTSVLSRMKGALPPELETVIASSMAMVAGMTNDAPPACQGAEKTLPFDKTEPTSITAQAALMRCVDLGVMPGYRITKELATSEGTAELAAIARLVLAYDPEHDDFVVSNALDA